MFLFLAKILYILLAIVFFPLDLMRNVLYWYMVKKEYDKMLKATNKMFGGIKFEDLHKK